MPPQLLSKPYFRVLNAPSLGPSLASSGRSQFSSNSRTKTRKGQNPYAIAQARQRKAANLSRQAVLKKERASSAYGEPVLGNPTPFIESLMSKRSETLLPSHLRLRRRKKAPDLNHYLTSTEFQAALERSKHLTEPVVNKQSHLSDPQANEEARLAHEEAHRNAQQAMSRIIQLENGSNKDRTRVNIQRCIHTFGRHVTDSLLESKPPAAIDPSAPQYPARPARAGPDTGSSEVQAAILTTKIQVLAQQIAKYGHKDKHNKRNLRVLVHRRQRLLNYLRRKERGGPRWQNLMSNLGLTDSSWKGEIIYSYAWDDVEDSTRHFFNGRTTQITKGSTRNPKECTRAV
ncbi:ribosomal protein S15 [Histoplasma capsulatum var. duboisii H88]|uniref:Ribosomal protein S15 n=1 Tax=Ajellomyces capsulatus (strain H88) TaxID=544711 RepID=F0UDL7_AJEC8|nr:ribosomal protein S15 [Histoplasma capsulatum var. duboisii H88]